MLSSFWNKPLTGWWGRRISLAVTLLAFAFYFWNAIDEFYILGSYKNVMFILALWMLAPVLNLIWGWWMTFQSGQQISALLAMLYAVIGFVYAINGSTSGKMGAQHMHLVLVPPIFAIFLLFALVLVALFWLVRGMGTSIRNRRLSQEQPLDVA